MKVNRITRLVAIGLATGAIAAPAATAMPVPPDSSVPSSNEPVAIEPEPVVQSVNEGFDWGSAAIGAGAAGALIVLSLGGLGGSVRNRNRMRVTP